MFYGLLSVVSVYGKKKIYGRIYGFVGTEFGHDKVCANIVQLKKKFIIFVWANFLNSKISRFYHNYVKTKYAINITFYNIFNQFDGSNVFSGHIR